jgi:hypothetical protein
MSANCLAASIAITNIPAAGYSMVLLIYKCFNQCLQIMRIDKNKIKALGESWASVGTNGIKRRQKL